MRSAIEIDELRFFGSLCVWDVCGWEGLGGGGRWMDGWEWVGIWPFVDG